MLAVVSDAIAPYHTGGKETRYRELVPRLHHAGFRVRVYTMQWWDGPRTRVAADGSELRALCRCWPLYVGTRRSIVQAVAFSVACLRLLGEPIDVIEADQMPYLPLFSLRLVASCKRVPLVVTWHELWGWRYWTEYLGAAGLLGACCERLALLCPDRVVAENPETRRRLLDAGMDPERVQLVPCGVDVATVMAAPPAGTAFDVIYAGRFLNHKRLDLLLDALAQLRAQGTVLSCALIGAGPERPALEAQASALGLDEQVTFLGVLETDAEVYGVMKTARLFVLPSVREGFGLVVVEALACGIPVVTVDHPDNQARLLVDDGVTGTLCPPTITGMATAIATTLARALPPAAASETLARCDWEHITAQLADWYRGPVPATAPEPREVLCPAP